MLSLWPEGPVAWRKPFNLAIGLPEEMEGSDHAPSLCEGERPLEQRLSSFDPDAYLAAHRDVAEAGVNDYEHLIRHGLQEGRAWR